MNKLLLTRKKLLSGEAYGKNSTPRHYCFQNGGRASLCGKKVQFSSVLVVWSGSFNFKIPLHTSSKIKSYKT